MLGRIIEHTFVGSWNSERVTCEEGQSFPILFLMVAFCGSCRLHSWKHNCTSSSTSSVIKIYFLYFVHLRIIPTKEMGTDITIG
jgi:hypothetical protein